MSLNGVTDSRLFATLARRVNAGDSLHMDDVLDDLGVIRCCGVTAEPGDLACATCGEWLAPTA